MSSVKIHRKEFILIFVATMVIIVTVFAAYRLIHRGVETIPSTNPNKQASKVGRLNNGSEPQSANSSSENSPSSKDTHQNNNYDEPTGTFVSNHHPNLSGSPAPTSEQSVCITTPGAVCFIEFSKEGVTKKLEETKTDSSGAAYWNWDIVSAGLSQGSWKITAIAMMNGHSVSAVDPQNLEVGP